MDGTLLGVEENSKRLIPEWKRSPFSLLFNGAATHSKIYFVDHARSAYCEIIDARRKTKAKEKSIAAQASPPIP